MIERPILIRGSGSLFGILTTPDAPLRSSPLVVILNAGVLHHVGPNRLYVILARGLAEAGIASFRFDLAGQGDSDNRTDGADYDEGAVRDSRAVMDHLSTVGYGTFIMTGLCSGADHSVRILAADDRVVGAVPVEFLTFLSSAYEMSRLAAQVLSARSWRNALRGRVDWRAKLEEIRAAAAPKPPPEETVVWRMPEREEVGGWFRIATSRSARICLVYSKQEPGYHQYRTWLRRALREVPVQGVEVRLADRTDHLFTPADKQRWLVQTIVEVVGGWARTSSGALAPL